MATVIGKVYAKHTQQKSNVPSLLLLLTVHNRSWEPPSEGNNSWQILKSPTPALRPPKPPLGCWMFSVICSKVVLGFVIITDGFSLILRGFNYTPRTALDSNCVNSHLSWSVDESLSSSSRATVTSTNYNETQDLGGPQWPSAGPQDREPTTGPRGKGAGKVAKTKGNSGPGYPWPSVVMGIPQGRKFPLFGF